MIYDLTSVEVLLERLKLPVKTLSCKSVWGNTPLVLCGECRTSNIRSGNTQFDLNSFPVGRQQHTSSNQKPVEVDLSLFTGKIVLVLLV